ncbi:BNR repeat-containing protein [Roseomonas sp. 18066]|uniref:BNR repeat-containing protein n=1 Tax=Roseomonas sp. 18066 TaxID=2681412 RepID=UPI00135B9AD2|nr:BNR repeat-containing protein [Roseomonas sp. 18066]
MTLARHRRMLLPAASLLGLALAALPARAEAPACSPAPPQQVNGRATYELAQVWSGVRTEMGAARAPSGQLLVAYYDAERWMTVAALDPARQQVCRIRLPSRFTGWDAHNDISMAVAPDGSLHIVGNLHGDKLFYAAGRADDLASVKPAPMVGRDEERVTYPTFLRTPDNTLLFFYRSGASGRGTWLVNRWQGGQWQRGAEIFAGRDREGRLSAYPDFAMAPDGTLHAAIVWRRTGDVATNFAVSYARSRDFRRWEGATVAPQEAPVGPDDIDRLDTPGPNKGLVNNPRLVLTPEGTPVVFFTRQGEGGNDAIFAARPEGRRWVLREVATSNRQTRVAGTGALPRLPSMGVEAEGWTARLAANLPGRPQQLEVDLRTLQARPAGDNRRMAASSVAPAGAGGISLPQGLASARVGQQRVLQHGFDGEEQGRLTWFAQGANGDRPRDCTPQAPAACQPPPSPLRWTAP